jgi:hypothetical protein
MVKLYFRRTLNWQFRGASGAPHLNLLPGTSEVSFRAFDVRVLCIALRLECIPRARSTDPMRGDDGPHLLLSPASQQ